LADDQLSVLPENCCPVIGRQSRNSVRRANPTSGNMVRTGAEFKRQLEICKTGDDCAINGLP
jgi:hypothetical protein